MTATKTQIAPVAQKDFVVGPSGKPLTPAQIKAIKRMAYYRACIMRSQAMWSPDKEAAFFNGVMSVFHACNQATEIPAFWVMGQGNVLDRLAAWKLEGKKLV